MSFFEEKDLLGKLDKKLRKEHGVGVKDLLEKARKHNYRRKLKKEIQIPLEIFRCGLSPAEAVCKYLRENRGMSYGRISELLNRDQRTV